MVLAGWLPFFWGPPPFSLFSDPRVYSGPRPVELLSYAAWRSYELILIVSATVIGVFTISRGNKSSRWTHKANIALQITTIAVFLGLATYVALMAGFGTNPDGIRESEAKLAFAVFSSIILYLLLRPEVRAYYQRLQQKAPATKR